MKVPTRRFGKTEVQMPVYTCGGMRYQQSWNDKDPVSQNSQENLEATIKKALDLGINHFETARGYGTSEVQLGQILPGLDRDSILVQTKATPTPKADQFLRTFDASMKRLGLDYVDFLGIHGVNNESLLKQCLGKNGCAEAALKLKQEGRIRHLGFSTHAPTEVIIKAIQTDLFEYVNLHWYYLNQSNWPAIEEATRKDLGVFIISPSDKGGKLYSPSGKMNELCDPISPMVFNDLFCLSRPEVHTLSHGVTVPSDFDEHMKAVPFLDDPLAKINPILERLSAETTKILGADWVRSWEKGLPSWDRFPGQVNVREILRLRNVALAFDMVEYGKMRYNLLGNGGHWFPGNKADKLPSEASRMAQALSGSPHKKKIPEILREAHSLLSGEEIKRMGKH